MKPTNAERLATAMIDLLEKGNTDLDFTSIDMLPFPDVDGSFRFHVDLDFDGADGKPRRKVWEVSVKLVENSSVDDV